MRYVVVVLVGLLSLPTHGQDIPKNLHAWIPPYQLSTPSGWTTERFPIPISFAPQIPYKGVEDIRFTPGWSKAQSSDYWSYVYLWWLEGKPTLTVTGLQANLTAYYLGLVTQNLKNTQKNSSKETLAPTVTLKETTRGGRKEFSGMIIMLDYMSQRPITLHCLIHIVSCSAQTHTGVIVELSPQPMEHAIWGQLHAIEHSFSCNN